jgi:hypothetical protein
MLGLGALAGCGAQPGVAAVVDGEVITQEELSAVAAQYNRGVALTGNAWQPSEADTLAIMLSNAYARAVLAGTGNAELIEAARPVTVGEFAQLVDEQITDAETAEALKAEMTNPVAIDVLLLWAPSVLMTAQQEGFVEAEFDESALDLAINPRYGSLDYTNITMVAPVYPWDLSPPVAESTTDVLGEIAQ